MRFAQRRRRAIAVLAEKGIPLVRAEPAPVRVARAAGIRLRPLYFETFGCLSLYYGAGCAISWGIVRLLIGLPDGVTGLMEALAGGLVFGPLLAAAVRRHARKLGLPDWEALDAAGQG